MTGTSRRTMLMLLGTSMTSLPSFADPMRASEQEVIAAYLNSLADKLSGTKKSMVFDPNTSTTNDAMLSDGDGIRRLKSEFPEASDAVIADFLRVLTTSVPVEIPRRLVRSEIPWVIARQSPLDRIFNAKSLGDAWKAFYKEYPSASGLSHLSRVGIDEDSKQALFFMSHSPGGLGGRGYFVLMQRRFGVWRELATKSAWVS